MGLAVDLLTRGLFLVALIWASYLLWHLNTEIRVRQFRSPDKYPQYSDLLLALFSAVGMLLAQLLFRPLFASVARAMVPRKPRWSAAVWGAKVTRCCDAVFKCSYYASMTTWCWALLRGEPWLPPVLGGSGKTRFCWTDGYPFQTMPGELNRFYLIAAGYHMSEVAMLFLEQRHPDFWEMLLHHTVSVSLVSLSYALNYIRVGSLVLLLHGATDILIYLSKAIVDTPNMNFIMVTWIALVVAYGYFRIFVFPVYIMRSAWMESVAEAGASKIFGWAYLNFALCVLLFLHVYWFGLILKIGFLFRTTGQARDLQSNLSFMDWSTKKNT